jgi:SAM-dependent methyltransferase
VGGGTGRVGGSVDPVPVVFDASRPMLGRASTKGFATIQGDARSIPVGSGDIDAAVSVDAVHHLPDLGSVLGEVARVLRPGGVVVIRDFDPSTLRGRALAAAEHLVGFESTFHAADDVAAALAAAGLEPTVQERGFTYTVLGKRVADSAPE